MIIVSPEHNPLIAFVQPKKNLQQQSNMPWEKYVDSPEAQKIMMGELDKVWKTNKLKSIERISAVKLFAQEWTSETGWMTAAMKLRRQDLQKEHAEVIEDMFKKVESQ